MGLLKKEGEQMSILMEVLQEEMERLRRQQAAYEADLQELPKGYISKKNIRGKETCYLQRRDGDKIVSEYISPKNLQITEEQIKRRKQLESSLRRVKSDQKKLKKVLGWSYG